MHQTRVEMAGVASPLVLMPSEGHLFASVRTVSMVTLVKV